MSPSTGRNLAFFSDPPFGFIFLRSNHHNKRSGEKQAGSAGGNCSSETQRGLVRSSKSWARLLGKTISHTMPSMKLPMPGHDDGVANCAGDIMAIIEQHGWMVMVSG